jgi:uncharacterized protein YicC (UPF0701 family)
MTSLPSSPAWFERGYESIDDTDAQADRDLLKSLMNQIDSLPTQAQNWVMKMDDVLRARGRFSGRQREVLDEMLKRHVKEQRK